MDEGLHLLANKPFNNLSKLRDALKRNTQLETKDYKLIYQLSEKDSIFINPDLIKEKIDSELFTDAQKEALIKLGGKSYIYKWKLISKLAAITSEWQLKPESILNKQFNKDLKSKQEYVINTFRVNVNEKE